MIITTVQDSWISSIMDQLSNSFMVTPRRPVCTQDWEEQRSRFEQLYSTEDRPLGEVMKMMEKEYGFRATYARFLFSAFPALTA